LFSYGTLQSEAVQLAAFGRTLNGQRDALAGYRLAMAETRDHAFIATTGATHHRNLEFTGDASDLVEGTVFSVTEHELEQADTYEPFDYKRTLVQLHSGLHAWVYLSVNPASTDQRP
jgi:gamma-glutamylcyclotransferase (GGCT)/AIG2-like uncharacterized protein YtfP